MMVPHRALPLKSQRAAFTLLEVLVVVAILVILAGAASISVFRYLDDARINTARNTMSELEKACRNYAVSNGGIPPESLIEIVQPIDGNKPMIEGGINALNDPWGRQYQYDGSNMDNYGSPDPMVFTINPSTSQPLYSTRRK